MIAATKAGSGVIKEFSYDPWGRRRNPNNWNAYNVTEPTLFTRGFTGHEHIGLYGLINMDGRMYDPRLGRFLSPDPYVQAPGYTQSFNRYSYVWNNPLKYTDPSGYQVNDPNKGMVVHNGYPMPFWQISEYEHAVRNDRIIFSPSVLWMITSGSPDHQAAVMRRRWERSLPGLLAGVMRGSPYDHFKLEPGNNGIYWLQYGLGTIPNTSNSGGSPLAGSGIGIIRLDKLLDKIGRAQGHGSNGFTIANAATSGAGTLAEFAGLINNEFVRQANYDNSISKTPQPIKHSGKAITRTAQGASLVGGMISLAEFLAAEEKTWGSYGKLSIGLLSAGLTYAPEPITTGIGMAIGYVDIFGGFDGFYDALDVNQQLYKTTGLIVVPAGTIGKTYLIKIK